MVCKSQHSHSWLPNVFSWLSGLPECKRKRRIILPIQAFIDESGSKNQDIAFVLAGLIGHSEQWIEFSNNWQAALNESPSIAYFKMQEAANMKGQFGGWKFSQRDAKLKRLAGVLNSYKFDFISVSLDMVGFYEVMSEHVPRPMNNPYFVGFHQIIAAVGFHLLEHGQKEQFEIIFDENLVFGPRAKRWYPLVKDVAVPDLVPLLPPEPIFKNDHEFLPLQAADLFAWLIRRAWNDNQPQEFSWIITEIPNIRPSEHVQIVDRDRMKRMVEMSYTFPPEMLSRWKDLID